jgi:hypothetical protein
MLALVAYYKWEGRMDYIKEQKVNSLKTQKWVLFGSLPLEARVCVCVCVCVCVYTGARVCIYVCYR